MIKAYHSLIWMLVWMASGVNAVASESDSRLWYTSPAQDWESEGLPIGSGALGMMIMGGVENDRLQFNEKTLWTGGPGSNHGYDFGLPTTSIADKVDAVAAEIDKKGSLSPDTVVSSLGRKIKGYGNYQSFGEWIVQSKFLDNAEAENYQRGLNLATGMAYVQFNNNGVDYRREYFASAVDDVIVVNYSASQPQSISLKLDLETADNRSRQTIVRNDDYIAFGTLNENGLKWRTQAKVMAKNARISKQGTQLIVENADEVTIIIAAATDYHLSHPHYRGDDPESRVESRLAEIQSLKYVDLKERHIADHQTLFGRVKLDLHEAKNSIPTDRLLEQYGDQSEAYDRLLETLFFNYGRYLLIASSRSHSLPANLQGVWNNSATPPWNADYHVNINLQMNYWPALPLNLAETMSPYFDFVDNLQIAGRSSAQKIANAPGWSLHLNTNPWGFTGLIDWPTAFWQPEAAAWLCRLLFDYYLYSNDLEFLRNTAYPAMLGVMAYWQASLRQDSETGKLFVNPSYSPEHGDFSSGASMSQQIVYALLRDTKLAAIRLSDTDTVASTEILIEQLEPGLKIGRWGQLMEWASDLDDPDNHHRHISHLYALHPDHALNPHEMPKLAAAARKTLDARGDVGTGWSKAWKINMWARLYDGARAYKLLQEQLTSSTLSNLFDTHPPFQIDGNFGASAGIGEMLLQSQHGVIDILPALPPKWSNGDVQGLRARNGITVDIQWSGGQAQEVSLISDENTKIKLRSSLFDDVQNVELKKGVRTTFRAQKNSKPIDNSN